MKMNKEEFVDKLIENGEIEVAIDGWGNFIGYVDDAGHTYENADDVADAWGVDE